MPFLLKTRFSYDSDTELYLGFRGSNTLCVVSMTPGRILEEYYKQAQKIDTELPRGHLFELPYDSVVNKVSTAHAGGRSEASVLAAMHHIHIDANLINSGNVIGRNVYISSNLHDEWFWNDDVASVDLFYRK